MSTLDRMLIFTRVAELASFTQAADALGLPKATVRHWRGFRVSAMAEITPPLPAVSRPSITTIRRLPVCISQRARSLSSSCSGSSFSK